jgi:hypothetical protein
MNVTYLFGYTGQNLQRVGEHILDEGEVGGPTFGEHMLEYGSREIARALVEFG